MGKACKPAKLDHRTYPCTIKGLLLRTWPRFGSPRKIERDGVQWREQCLFFVG